MSLIKIESFYRERLLTPILSTDTASVGTPLVVKVSATPELTSGLLTISPNTDNEEVVYYASKSDANLTISITHRAISPVASALTVDGTDYNVTEYLLSHTVLDAVRGDISNLHINQTDGFVELAGDTMSGPLAFSGTTNSGLKVNSLTTAERTALTGANGMVVYDSTIGENYQYVSGAWVAVSGGSTQANSSSTVAGKVELATQTEVDTPTDTGGTGAGVVVIPSTFQLGVTNRIASQAEAESGSSSTKLMTPQRTNNWFNHSNVKASQAQAEGFVNDGTWMSPLRTAQAIAAYIPTLDDTFARSKLVSTTFTDSISNYDLGIPHGTYSKIMVNFTILLASDYGSSTGTLWYDGTNTFGNKVGVGLTDLEGNGYANFPRAAIAEWKEYTSDEIQTNTATLDKGTTNYRFNFSKTFSSSNNGVAIFHVVYA